MENKTQPLRIFVVEDSSIVRERLVAMLNATPNVAVVGEAATPAAAITGISDTQPDAVLLDVHLIDGSGIEVLRAIHPRLPGVIFIVLTNYTVASYRDAYLRAGASYYLDKSHEFNSVPGIVAGLQKNAHLPSGDSL